MAFIALVSPWENPPNPSMGGPPAPVPPPPPAGVWVVALLRLRSALVTRLVALCCLNRRWTRFCWAAYSPDRHRCRCRSLLRRLRRLNSCTGPGLVGAPPRIDSDLPGYVWIAPHAAPGLGSDSLGLLPLLPLALLPGRLGSALLLWRGSRWLRRVSIRTRESSGWVFCTLISSGESSGALTRVPPASAEERIFLAVLGVQLELPPVVRAD
jgi:hypothetical protein